MTVKNELDEKNGELLQRDRRQDFDDLAKMISFEQFTSEERKNNVLEIYKKIVESVLYLGEGDFTNNEIIEFIASYYPELNNSIKTDKNEIVTNVREIRNMFSDCKFIFSFKNTFQVDTSGVYYIEIKRNKEGDNETLKRYITLTPVFIAGVGVNLDEGENWYKLKYLDNNMDIKSTWKPNSVLLSRRGISELQSENINVVDNKSALLNEYFSGFIKQEYKNLQPEFLANTNGWKRGNSLFVLGDTAYSIDGRFPIQITNPQIKNPYEIVGSLDAWVEGMREILDYDLVRLKCYAVMTPIILDLIDADSFILHNVGSSGVGKTITSTVVMSMFGNPEALKISARSTKIGLMQKNKNDPYLPMCIDEISENPNFKQNIYNLINKNNRVTGTVDGGMRETDQFPTVLLTTGEREILDDTGYEGEHVRILNVNGGLPPGNHDLVEKARSVALNNYGHVFDLYIRRVLEHRGEFREQYVIVQKKLPKIESVQADRIKCHFAAMVIAGVLLEDVFEEVGIETKDPFEICSTYFLDCIRDASVEKFYVNILRRTYDWFKKNQAFFDKVDNGGHPVSLEDKRRSVRYGWETPDYIDIIPSELTAYFRTEEIEISQALKAWRDEGITKCNERKFKYQATKDGSKITVIRLIKERVEEVLD